MKKNVLIELLSIALMFGIISGTLFSAADGVPEELDGKVKSIALSAETFVMRSGEELSALYNVISGDAAMTVEAVDVPSDDEAPFDKALKFDITALSQNTSGVVNANALAIKYLLKNSVTNIEADDIIMLKFAAKTVGGPGKIGYRFFDSDTNTDTLTKWSGYPLAAEWTYYYLPAKAVNVPNQFIMRFGEQLQTVYIADLEIINYGTNVQLSDLPTGSARIVPAGEKTYIPTEGEKVITPENFIENTKAVSESDATGSVGTESIAFDGFEYTSALKISRTSDVSSFAAFTKLDGMGMAETSGNVVHLEFYAKALTGVMPVEISLSDNNGAVAGDTTFTYYVPTQWTKFSVPYSCTSNVGGVRFDIADRRGDILVSGLSLTYYGKSTTIAALEHGQFLCPEEGWKKIDLDDSATGFGDASKIGRATDVDTDGEYLYVINGGAFDILSIKEDPSAPVWKSGIENLGTVRQIRLVPDKEAVIITARDCGMYIIDVTDKENPVIAAAYDTIEMATGLAVTEKYAFVSCRTFGTEIIDISDINKPRHVSVIYSGEAQSCEIIDGLLYAGCWANREVQVFDVSNPANPRNIVNIPLTGQGDGIKIKDGILYAATGHHSPGYSSTSPKGALSWGYGNGMDIFDVSDIKNGSYTYLSTVRIDGTFYKLGDDYWTVELSERNGTKYAYLSNTFNGIFVYDVTNPESPIRLSHISVVIPSGTARYNQYKGHHGIETVTSDFHFPYDTSSFLKSPIGGFAVTDGYMYIAATGTDLHIFDASEYGAESFVFKTAEREPSGTLTEAGEFYDFDFLADTLTNYEHTMCGGQAYAAAEKDGIIYAACGFGGIRIYDEDLNLLKNYDVGGIVGDVKVFGDRLYAAEGRNGTSIYSIGEDKVTLTRLSNKKSLLNYSTFVQPAKQLLLSTDGNYVLVHLGGQYAEVIDFRDLDNPVGIVYDDIPGETAGSGQTVFNSGSTGLLYYRQFSSGLVDGRYAVIMWHTGVMKVIDMLEDENGAIPHAFVASRKITGASPMSNGIAPYGDKVVTNLRGSHMVFDPLDETLSNLNTLTKYVVKDKSGNKPPKDENGNTLYVSGKTVIEGSILCASNRTSGEFFAVDVTDIENAVLLSYIKVNSNPDLALITDKYIYIPAGNAGIIRFSIIDDPNAVIGDINGDKVVNAADLTCFLKNISRRKTYAQMDTNRDGTVTLSDLSQFFKNLIGG